jgi:hypothetical protein
VAIARLAATQHNVVSLTQLNALGLGKAAVAKRAAGGRLHRIVYAVGHGRLTGEGHWMAAVLAYGPSAVLSHRSAAALWGLRPDNRAKTDVSLPSRSARSRPGIDLHMTVTLTAADVTRRDGIACTAWPVRCSTWPKLSTAAASSAPSSRPRRCASSIFAR